MVGVYILIPTTCIEMAFYRLDFDACEITTCLYLPLSYKDKKVSYKYVVYSGRTNGVVEYIHDLPERGTYNRCLDLSQISCKFTIT